MDILNILFYVGSVFAGGLAGLILSIFLWYLLLRFVFKYPTALTSTIRLLFGKRVLRRTRPSEKHFTDVSSIEEHSIPSQIFTKPSAVEIDKNPLGIVSELLIEFKYNLNIAREFTGENLVSLKTDIWDTKQYAINTLSLELQKQLKNLYDTAKLLNELVWFSTEFQRRNSALNEQYANLLNIIVRKQYEITDLLFLDFTRMPLHAVTTKITREIELLRGSH